MKTSITDTDKYKGIIKLMLQNESTFNNFKQLPEYTEVLEHVSYKLGVEYLTLIKRDNPQLLERIDEFKMNDLYGNPKWFSYDEIGGISPTTLRYVKVLSDLIKLGIDLTDKNVIEIGVGYGGQCLIISKNFKFKSYTLVDLKEPLDLTKKYLELSNVNNVKFKEMNELGEKSIYDLVISNYAFSECAKEIQHIYSEKVFKNSKNGYITTNFTSDIYNVNSYNKGELLGLVEDSYTIDEEPLTGKNNMILVW